MSFENNQTEFWLSADEVMENVYCNCETHRKALIYLYVFIQQKQICFHSSSDWCITTKWILHPTLCLINYNFLLSIISLWHGNSLLTFSLWWNKLKNILPRFDSPFLPAPFKYICFQLLNDSGNFHCYEVEESIFD